MAVTRTEAIKRFLIACAPDHSKDLVALYHSGMECQVNVAQDNGTRVEGDYQGRKWHGWTDGMTTWKSFRIPYNANSEPRYDDPAINFNIEEHAEGIGCTGWEWSTRTSKWVAYDFDSLIGHKAGLTEQQMNEVKQKAHEIPWVTVRKSTSGKGIHLYVYVDSVPTANHNEHAALARAILGKMSALTGFDFAAHVDTCGGNIWIWHRKQKDTDGLCLIKQGEVLKDIPSNWRDHVDVVKGVRKRIKVSDVAGNTDAGTSEEDELDKLTGQYTRVPLDETHKKLIKYLEDNGCVAWWDADHYMLVTHTVHLKEAHTALELCGIFDTKSSHSTPHNCFGGDVELMTINGPRKFKDVAGTTQKVYSLTFDGTMKWIDAEIKHFGKQVTYPLLFGDKTVIRATKEHAWLYRKNQSVDLSARKYTFELTPKTEIPLAKFDLPDMSMEGYAHGFVYGDGWRVYDGENRHCDVALFKHDKDLRETLLKFGKLGYQNYNGTYVDIVRKLPFEWKDLPINPTKSYALGFVMGVLAADGFVGKTNCLITQSDYDAIHEIRNLALFAGLRCYPVQRSNVSQGSFKNSKQGYRFTISTYNLSKHHFLRKDHQTNLKVSVKRTLGTSVTYIDWNDGLEEDVYCAVVPEVHNFTLANGAITGNCFLYPLVKGAWVVRRFGQGVQEHESWEQDKSGWTKCYFNRLPDLKTSVRMHKGIEHEKGGFLFDDKAGAESAQTALRAVGLDFEIPPWARKREAEISYLKDGKLLMKIKSVDGDVGSELPGWYCEKGFWRRVFNAPSTNHDEVDTQSYDDILRHVVTEDGDDAGWSIKSDNMWRDEPLVHIGKALKSLGFTGTEADLIIGKSVLRAWSLVNMPFQSEYPGNRRWNRSSAQFAVTPSDKDREELNYPTWIKLLKHCGESLNEAIQESKWAKENGIVCGADYLKCWIASMIQQPQEPLPYLFFWGPQNTGKSVFHEALHMLIKGGICRADNALTSTSGFNGEIANKVLCVIEEVDLGRAPTTVYNRIKDWVTSRQLPVHIKGVTPYTVINTTHWIQCANDIHACPIFEGDTRITVIHVGDLDESEKMPKRDLMNLLAKEAPDFLRALLNLELPHANDRLSIPVILTEDKKESIEAFRSPVEIFCKAKCFYAPGKLMSLSEFFDAFHEWLEPERRAAYTRIRVGRELPSIFLKGRNFSQSGAPVTIGNISFTQPTEEELKFAPYVLTDGKLILRGKGDEDNSSGTPEANRQGYSSAIPVYTITGERPEGQTDGVR